MVENSQSKSENPEQADELQLKAVNTRNGEDKQIRNRQPDYTQRML